MFTFLVKRLVSGLVIVVLVSLAVFTLFFYGPKSPALELCRRDTHNRCGPTSPNLKEYEERLGYNNPMLVGVRQVGQGLVAGRTIIDRRDDVQLRRSVPGHLLPGPHLGLRPAEGAVPVTLSLAIGASVLYLLIGVTVGVLAARRRGTIDRQAAGVVDLGLQLGALLPGGAAEHAHAHHHERHLPARGVPQLPGQPAQVGHRAAAGLAGAGHLRLHVLHPLRPGFHGRVAQ